MVKALFLIILIAVVAVFWYLVIPEQEICEDLCGDGECQEIVCQGSGCPCSESIDSCAQDCINSFETCVAAGNPVMESYPRQCQANGEVFVEYIGNELEKLDLIVLDNPRPNQEIESPLVVRGRARGYWFFEGDFPVILVDWDGLIISQGIAQAQGEWMNEDFVEFEAVLEFEKPSFDSRGSLILQKDNPSGLPENDDALEIPIVFK